MSKQVRSPDAIWNYGPDNAGMTQVVVFRYKSKATHVGVFLVDQLCMGVKNAFFAMLDDSQLDEFRAKFDGFESVEVGCAKRLVDESISFAAKLGFAPHADYARAASIFAEIPACAHHHAFKLGEDGKPHFVAGPNDSEQFVRMVLARLTRLCGEGNYHFTVPGSFDHVQDERATN